MSLTLLEKIDPCYLACTVLYCLLLLVWSTAIDGCMNRRRIACWHKEQGTSSLYLC